MTTNHKPTFESRRGRDLQPTSIVHARALPAHKQLKYRVHDKIDLNAAKRKLDELKDDLIQREAKHFKSVRGESQYKDESPAIEYIDVEDDEDEDESSSKNESSEERRKRILKESAAFDESDDNEDEIEIVYEKDSTNLPQEESEEDSGEDSEDDSDDEEALLKELEKLKKERAEAKKQKELEAKQEEALTSNPLLNINEEAKPIRKNWRQDTVFKSKNSVEKKEDSEVYYNDLLKSKFHQRFLDKYIK